MRKASDYKNVDLIWLFLAAIVDSCWTITAETMQVFINFVESLNNGFKLAKLPTGLLRKQLL